MPLLWSARAAGPPLSALCEIVLRSEPASRRIASPVEPVATL